MFTSRAILLPRLYSRRHSRVTRIILLPPFFPEASRQLKLFYASLPVSGLEPANQTFSYQAFLRVFKREDPQGQKWTARISDRSLFWGGFSRGKFGKV